MTCPTCSAPVDGQFCSRCGVRVPPAVGYQYQATPPSAPPAPGYAAPAQPYAYPPMPYIPRVQNHLKTLGILWCVYGGYRLLTGIAGSLLLLGLSHRHFFDQFSPERGFPFSIMPMMGGIAVFVLLLSLGAAALAFFTGFSLLHRKPFGRTLAIVSAVLSLIKIPFGTGLGIYTLWVLVSSQSGAEYQAIADYS